MPSSRILSLLALIALAVSAGCSGCDKTKEDPQATCSDGSKNGAETGVDCGGATCVAEGKTCADGAACGAPTDCTSGVCLSSVCTARCADGLMDFTETDVDCGGACVAEGKTCADTKACAVGTDCASGYCDATLHCAQPCGQDGATCATGGDCCTAFCDATSHCATPCKGNGTLCGGASECCTGICSTTCQPPTTCTGNGLSCAAGTECCSGFCSANNLCADPCKTNGATCAAGGECCSSFCNASNQCADPCKTNGATCGLDSECCTNLCTGLPKTCTVPVVCTDNGLACPTAPGTCCSGYCDTGSGKCAVPCKPNGNSCTFGSDCCSTYCTAGKVCDNPPTCKANGVSCAANGECCLGYCNSNTNVCETPVSTCQDAGVTCTDNVQCCSSSCAAGKCTTTSFCRVPGAACTVGTDCCSGTCAGGLCSDTACTATGGNCAAPSDCCTGLCSGNKCQALPGASACKTLGDSCALGTDCCSTNCQGGRCTPAYLCHAPNDVCYGNDECCSGHCDLSLSTPGRCVLPSGGCKQDGAPCAGASNCCTRLCVDMGAGVTVCKPSSGCRMTGDHCDSTAACCGGSPDAITAVTDPGIQNPYKIFCDTAGTRPLGDPNYDPSTTDDFRCSGGTACNPPGNICGAAGDPASQNCCAGKKAVCKRDSQGIARCFGGCPNDDCSQCPDGYGMQYAPPCCIEAGTGTANVCQFRDQCCGGVPCVPDANGVLHCTVPTCTALHGACEGADDPSCCSGTTCEYNGASFSCEVPSSCGDLGTVCTVASDCCSNNCVAGVCTPPCVGTGGICTLDECCTGLACNKVNPTDASGVCGSVSTCAQTGQACDATKPCCSSAEACLNGVCAVPPACKAQYASCLPTDSCCATPPGMTCMESNGAACATGSTTCSCDNCSPDAGACNPSATPTGCCLGLTCNGSGATGTCGTCGLLTNDCTSDGVTDSCCTTLHCSNPADGSLTGCTTPGTCKCDACIPVNQACSYGGTGCCGAAYCARFDGVSTVSCADGDTDCTCIENL